MEPEYSNIIDSLQHLIGREKELENVNRALEATLVQNNVYVIVFDASFQVKSHNLPVKGAKTRVSEFVPYVDQGLLDKVRAAIAAPAPGYTNLLMDGVGSLGLRHSLLACSVEPPLYVLQFGFPGTGGASETETVWDATSTQLADVQSLINALDGIRRLDPRVDDEGLRKEILELRLPELRQLRKVVNDPVLALCLDIIEKNLDEILSPELSGMTKQVYARLTPSEIQIADFIRMGKSTKDIADALDIATKTVENHRNNLREKLGIRNAGVNLRTYLMQLED